jgi:putative oxidoreductase
MAILQFLGKYRETGLLLLRVSIGIIFILICAPVLFAGGRRWAQFGGAMRVFNFHAHLDWWGFFGALTGCISGILLVLGLAFRLGVLFAFIIAVVNAIAVNRHDHALADKIGSIEIVVILLCLSFIGPGKFSVDKN